MRSRALVLCVGLAMGAGCPDPGLSPMAFCEELLTAPAGGGTCSVEYVACPDSFTCSWRVDCTVSGGTTTCHCVATHPEAGCHIDATWDTTADLYGAVAAGDRGAVRDVVVLPCLGTTPANIDFSRI